MPAAPLIALVALNDHEMPLETRLFEALRQLRPEYQASQVEHKEGAVVFRLNGDLAAVSVMPHPIDWSKVAVACVRAWYWPEAVEALRNHVAYVLVAIQPEAADRLRAAMSLTALTAAVANTTQAAGVYWSASGLVHAPEAFATYAKQMTPSELPLLLWVSLQLSQESDGSFSVYTTGLREFGQMEIEAHGAQRDRQFLLDRVFDVVHYLLEKNPVLRDGETIGTTDEEKLLITVGPSKRDPNMEVVHLEL